MKETGRLLRPEMVRAVLNGTKTQTRDPMKPHPVLENGVWRYQRKGYDISLPNHSDIAAKALCPWGWRGDRLWVRETFSLDATHEDDKKPEFCAYRATQDTKPQEGWTPSIHMPRWASRITLEIANIRVERIQDISEEDARAEGVARRPYYFPDNKPASYARNYGWHRNGFARLWDTIYASKNMGWEANPWVWVIEFEKM